MGPRHIVFLYAAAASLCVGACGDSGASDSESAHPAASGTAPLISKSDNLGGDRADRECLVTLRSVMRYPDGADFEQDCSGGDCAWVWRGIVDVAESVDPEAQVGVLYHLGTDPVWWEVDATAEAGAGPGFRRTGFAISEHLFGPADLAGGEPTIQLIAFLRLPDGSRVFDHNRFAGDFETTTLDAGGAFGFSDGGTCQPVVGTVWFTESFEEGTSGLLRQGGYLEVRYDIDRLPDCRGTHNGFPAWDVVAYARFLPGGQTESGSVRQLGNVNGTPTNDATDAPLIVRIPDDATSVELWFRNATGAGSSCEAWDSNYGSNYPFEVLPAADDPRCQDVEKETGAHTEDDRMAHNQSTCLPYTVDVSLDAEHCELFVDGFGDGYVGHYGIPFHWALAYLRVTESAGEVLGVGMYTGYHDAGNGVSGERFSLGLKEGDGLWRAGFAYQVQGFQSMVGCDLTIDALAFFVDVRRPDGTVARLWESRHGANYRWTDAFTLPPTTESIPYGNIKWADQGAAIFASKHGCQ